MDAGAGLALRGAGTGLLGPFRNTLFLVSIRALTADLTARGGVVGGVGAALGAAAGAGNSRAGSSFSTAGGAAATGSICGAGVTDGWARQSHAPPPIKPTATPANANSGQARIREGAGTTDTRFGTTGGGVRFASASGMAVRVASGSATLRTPGKIG
jgi:hypothetical protein